MFQAHVANNLEKILIKSCCAVVTIVMCTARVYPLNIPMTTPNLSHQNFSFGFVFFLIKIIEINYYDSFQA